MAVHCRNSNPAAGTLRLESTPPKANALLLHVLTLHSLHYRLRVKDVNFKVNKMAAGCHIGFGPTGSSAIRSAETENPTLELTMMMKWIG